MCAVGSNWTNSTGLIGYYDSVSGKYIVTPFLEAILMATTYKDISVFVCLDRMNLARAEFYLAEVLSAMEYGLPLYLHSYSVMLEGSGGEHDGTIITILDGHMYHQL